MHMEVYSHLDMQMQIKIHQNQIFPLEMRSFTQNTHNPLLLSIKIFMYIN